jgi:PAS domain S-box-containing protein
MNYKLKDLIDVPLLQKMQELLYLIYPCPTAIIDNEGSRLTQVAWLDICAKFHRAHPECEQQCILSDIRLSEMLSKGELFVSHKCPFGLIDSAIRIEIDGKHLGNFHIGQFLYENPDTEYFRRQAAKYGFDENEYLKSLSEVPVRSEEKLANDIDRIKEFVEIIAGLGAKKLRESELERNLQQGEERLRFYSDHSPIGMIETDSEFKILLWNRKAEEMFGLKSDEVMGKSILDINFIYEPDIPTVLELIHQLTAGPMNNAMFTNRNYSADGGVIICEWYNTVMTDDEGKMKSVLSQALDVTTRVNYEMALKESEERFHLLFTDAPMGYQSLDMDGNLIEVNEKWCDILGYSREEVIGRWFGDFLVPEYRNLFSRRFENFKFCGQVKAEFEMFHKEGRRMFIAFEGKIGNDFTGRFKQTHCILQDVSAKRKAEADLIKEKENAEKSEKMKTELLRKLNEAQQTANVGSWDWDLKNGEVWWSDELYRIFEADKEKYVPSLETIVSFFHPEDTATCQSAINELIKKGHPFDKELRIISASGKVKYCRATARTYSDQNGITGKISGTLSDITGNKIIENELLRAKEKAEESDRLKTAFLRNMSHEVRTPLNSIVGFSQLMVEKDRSPEKLEKYAQLISSSSEKLIGIITDVIDISRIQANQVEINLTEIELISFLRGIVSSSLEKAERKHLKLSLVQKIPTENSVVVSDREMLTKIVFHLIDNALKFTHSGSIELFSSINNSNFLITVSDTGIGISSEMCENIFKPFVQVENDLCRNYGGNGLGLPIVKAFTELLKGSVALSSEENKGSSFTITIPLNIPVPQSCNGKVDSCNFLKKSSKVLIAEDEYINFRYLYELLNSGNIEIIYAPNGQHAVDACRNDSSIDIVLMDLKMPVMDGSTAARLIKQMRPGLPIIAQMAYALESERIISFKCFDDFIVKPIRKDVLRKKLRKFLNIG